jgi:alkaline phosphatase D
MQKLAPKFIAFTGDNVYYDSEEPRANNAALARYHWQRMSSLPRHVELHRNVAGYWEKDDHDTLSNDSWAGMRMGELEFEVGQQIFRQQVPLGSKIYRTYRWGRDLQIWLTDGRDFRSNNKMPDGPEKTIWGREQKEWFQRTVLESDSTWKVLISPTPVVGPDRGSKNDNHANTGFTHEGDEIRRWIQKHTGGNLFVICGDRHWQYHSVHPQTGLNEFSVGPASDAHAQGSPGMDSTYHKFHRMKGGFLTVELARNGMQSELTVRHRDVLGEVVYEWKQQRAAGA